MTGRWHRDGTACVLAAASALAGGAWRTLDGRIVAGVLQAVLVDGSTATVAHLVADLIADPGAAAPVASPTPQAGLPNAHPMTALDVDFPVYDIEFQPLAHFPDGRPHRAALHLVPSADERFAMSLTSSDPELSGSLHWSGDGLRRDVHLRGSRVHLRWPDTSGEPPRWLDEGRPLDLTDLDLAIDFDPAEHRVSGEVRGRTATGEPARATFTGVLQAHEVQRLREQITFPDCSGSWMEVIGGNDQLTVRQERSAEPLVLDLPDRRLRFVPALDLLVGLRPGAKGSSELVVLRRALPVVLDLPDDLDARQALRLLGQDLCAAAASPRRARCSATLRT